MGMGTPSDVGARAELAVAAAMWRQGMAVYLPFFAPHSRVDLIAGRSADLLRVQCKTARVVRGAICFPTCSSTAHVRLDYRHQVDSFGVYAPDLDLVYLVPVDEVPIREATLRLEPPRNNQRVGIRWAVDYLVGPP